MHNKKAQVTVFIILGLVMIIGTMLFLGIQGKLAFFNPDAIIAPDRAAVSNFVESCLRETLQDGVTLVAFQGGYAKIEEGPWKINKGGEYQEFLGKNGFKIPYWQNQGRNFMPSKDELQNNLELYVDNRIDYCLQNLTPLKEFYDLKILGEPKSKIVLGTDKATVELYYPLVITTLQKAGKTGVEKFYSSVDTNMLGAFELAKLIKEDNDKNDRLWNQTMEMIAGSELPYKGYEINCRDARWKMSELESDFNNLAKANLRYLTYKNTFNEKILGENPYPLYYENRYFFDIGAERKHQKFSVSVSPLKTTEFSVFPNKGDTVTSIDMQLPMVGDIIDPCINLYNHFYTMDYAVKFTINDENGLKFNFIIPVNVLYNKQKDMPEQYDEFNKYTDDSVLYDINYSMSVSDYCADTPYDLDVYVSDEITGVGIPNVTAYYDCVVFRCKIGQTDYIKDDYGIPISKSTILKGSFPECINGNLIFENSNYQKNDIFITPKDVFEPINIDLKPIIEIPISLELKRVVYDTVKSEILNYENLSVYISVINNDNGVFEQSSLTVGVDDINDFRLRIPLNDSGDNNITIDVRTINLKTNVSVGGYYHNGLYNGKSLINTKMITLPILTSELDPTNQEQMIEVYKNIVFPKSHLFKPIFS